MRHFAYIRVSTVEQNTDRQLAKCTVRFDKYYEDKCSGKDTNRPQLKELLIDVATGDTVHVHSFDRLARNTEDLKMLIEKFNSKGVTVQIHNPSLTFGADADNSINKLMLSILGAVGEFERSLIRERQAEGIAKAKERGVYKGAKRKADRTKVKNMLAEGVPKAQIAKRLGIARQTVYDIIASDKIFN